MSRIVLASASPRRRELLEQIGLEFEICPAKGEEVITAGSVDGAVLELSVRKRKKWPQEFFPTMKSIRSWLRRRTFW